MSLLFCGAIFVASHITGYVGFGKTKDGCDFMAIMSLNSCLNLICFIILTFEGFHAKIMDWF